MKVWKEANKILYKVLYININTGCIMNQRRWPVQSVNCGIIQFKDIEVMAEVHAPLTHG